MMILLNLKIKRDNVEGWHPAQPLVNLDIGSESFLKILIIRWIKKNKQIEKQPKLCKYFWIFCVHANLLLSWQSDGFLNSIIKASHSCFKITFYGEFQTKGDRAAWWVHACTLLSVSVCQLSVWRARAALRPRPRLFGNESKTCHSIWKYFCIDLWYIKYFTLTFKNLK